MARALPPGNSGEGGTRVARFRWVAMVIAFALVSRDVPADDKQPGVLQARVEVQAGRTEAAPSPAAKATISEATFEDLARQVVQLYERIAELARDETLSQVEKHKQRAHISEQVARLIKEMHQGGRNFYFSKAYQAWRRKQGVENRGRRLNEIRKALNVKDDDEWQVVAPKIDLVLRAREQLGEAEKRIQLWSPPEKVQQLRSETSKADPDRKTIQGLLEEIRAERSAARQEADRLRAVLHAAQQDLISVLTLKQEAILVVNQVID